MAHQVRGARDADCGAIPRPVQRSRPDARPDYRQYRDDVRADFNRQCGYCTVSETEAVVETHELDHYWPQKIRPDLAHAFANLVLCCRPCNGKKWSRPPHHPQDPSLMIVRPDDHEPSDHYAMDGLRIQGRTPAGRFSADLLDLNRQPLLEMRRRRRRDAETDATLASVLKMASSVGLDAFRPPLRWQWRKIVQAAAKQLGTKR